MGVDGRLFALQRESFPDLETPAWLSPEHPRESFAHYAERLASSCRRGNEAHRPVVVGGLSMGGMLALEMAKHLNAPVVALIGSGDHPCAASRFLMLGERVGRFIPDAVFAIGKSLAKAFVGRGGVPPERRRLLQDMLGDMDVGFLKWAGRAVVAWGGVLPGDIPNCEIRHIHGTRDWVLPISRLRTPPTQIVEGGAHVLSMSHPEEVDRFLRSAMTRAME